ncbi:MAG: mannosyltransferase family protein [Jiangellales bacterium]
MRLGPVDRAALGMWALWRLGVGLVGVVVGVLNVGVDGYGWLERWTHWDVVHYVGIARAGYVGEPTGVPNEAFLPGLPLLMRAGAAMGVSEVVAGLVVSALAGAVAAVALARLAERHLPDSGRWAVAAWLLAPTAVFLAAPYSEALFLALALPAWLAAQNRRWWLAGLLTAMAVTVRVSALFLLVALVVKWLTERPRRWRDVAWLGLPALPVAAIVVAQHAATGSWTAWWDAQSSPEWSRTARPPWETVANTWDAAFAGSVEAMYVWPFRLELVAVAVGVLTVVWCLRQRLWAEATFVALNVVAFTLAYWYLSVPRAALLWWPAFLAVAALIKDRPVVRVVWLVGSGVVAAVWAARFFGGEWAG